MIDKQIKKEIINCLKYMKENQSSLKDMQDKILDDFGLLLNLKTISKYTNEANNEEWLKRLKEQNEKVNNWLKECDAETTVNKAELMAEQLGVIFNLIKF